MGSPQGTALHNLTHQQGAVTLSASQQNQRTDVRFGSKADIGEGAMMSALPPKADIAERDAKSASCHHVLETWETAHHGE